MEIENAKYGDTLTAEPTTDITNSALRKLPSVKHTASHSAANESWERSTEVTFIKKENKAGEAEQKQKQKQKPETHSTFDQWRPTTGPGTEGYNLGMQQPWKKQLRNSKLADKQIAGRKDYSLNGIKDSSFTNFAPSSSAKVDSWQIEEFDF
jgi:hypothetical protein